MRGDQQARAARPAHALQPLPRKPADLFVTVDDELRALVPIRRLFRRDWQPALARPLGEPGDPPSGRFEGRYECVQQGRLAATMRTDDLPPPALGGEPGN